MDRQPVAGTRSISRGRSSIGNGVGAPGYAKSEWVLGWRMWHLRGKIKGELFFIRMMTSI